MIIEPQCDIRMAIIKWQITPSVSKNVVKTENLTDCSGNVNSTFILEVTSAASLKAKYKLTLGVSNSAFNCLPKMWQPMFTQWYIHEFS